MNNSVVLADNSVASFWHNASTANFTGTRHAIIHEIVSNFLSQFLIQGQLATCECSFPISRNVRALCASYSNEFWSRILVEGLYQILLCIFGVFDHVL